MAQLTNERVNLQQKLYEIDPSLVIQFEISTLIHSDDSWSARVKNVVAQKVTS